MTNQVAVSNPFEMMAGRLSMEPAAVESLMRNTLMQAKRSGEASNEELMVFMSIANEYKLNPLSKEIYAFNNRGAIQPIVSVDGWLKIINSHPQFDGMEFVDHMESGHLTAVTCRIYRKDRSRATEVTEYMNECQGISEPWKKWPARMLRHKATIQAARYAFGLSGIVDPDEAGRIKSATAHGSDPVASADIGPALQTIQNSQSLDELKAAGVAASNQHPQHKDAFRAAYMERKQELDDFEKAASADAVDGEFEEVAQGDDIPGV